jgi:hypothetical protein
MRVLHNGLKFAIAPLPKKILEAGEYQTEDPTEIELLTTLAEADALTILSQ